MADESDVFQCELLCREFLKRAKDWRDAKKFEGKAEGRHSSSVAEHAALIRCSLDLWRALAFMRRR